MEISLRSCHLPATRSPPLLSSLPSFLPGSSPLPPSPRTCHFTLSSLRTRLLPATFSPFPSPHHQEWSQGFRRDQTLLPASFPSAAFKLVRRTRGREEGSPSPRHHSTPTTSTPKPDFAFCILGAGQTGPGPNSLSTPRGWHTQVSKRQLRVPVFRGRCGCKVCWGCCAVRPTFEVPWVALGFACLSPRWGW